MGNPFFSRLLDDATELVHFRSDLRLDTPKNRVIASSRIKPANPLRFAFLLVFSAPRIKDVSPLTSADYLQSPRAEGSSHGN